MFSSKQRLKDRTGQHGTPRLDYLQELVNEFQSTKNKDAQEQLVANLANFAYDPINYSHLRKLHVIDLFIDCLSEPNERLKEFGMGGLCNCCNDPLNAEVIVAHGIPNIVACLDNPVENTVSLASAGRVTPQSCNAVDPEHMLTARCEPCTAICNSDVMACLYHHAAPESTKSRIANIARVFLERHGDASAGISGQTQQPL